MAMETAKETGVMWRFAVDRGGTFTDVVGVDPDGVFHTEKLLSSSAAYGDPCIEGIRRVLGLSPGKALPADLIESIRFGTTAATNALLERKGGATALFITAGYRDLLDIGYQSRPDIFSLCIEKPGLLYSDVVEVAGRIGPDGGVETPLDKDALAREARRIRGSVDSATVVLVHSWKNPAHELAAEEVLRGCGVPEVHLSHRSVNLIKIVTRGRSAVVDAYLAPVMERYFEGIRKDTGDIPIEFIESSGTLTPPELFRGKGAVFSGPAGGVIAVARVAGEAGGGEGTSGAVGFDMGGTSTDVSRFDFNDGGGGGGGGGGGFEKVYEQVVGGVELAGESLRIETVASGGGSILWFDGARLRVGPESAGAVPGPACYGLGGPLAVTDANLATGRILPGFFPRTFGPDGTSPLDERVVREKLAALTERINASTGRAYSPEEAALGFLDIANGKMALAIKAVSLASGRDVRDYGLVSFGGAGGQHACRIASHLDMRSVIFHPLAGVMSAYGIGLARPGRGAARTVLAPYTEGAHRRLAGVLSEMEEETVPAGWKGRVEPARSIDLRPAGTDAYVTVPFTDRAGTLACFRRTYSRLFGFCPEDRDVEAVNLRFEARLAGEYFPAFHAGPAPAAAEAEPVAVHTVHYVEGSREAPVYRRETLAASARITGPAVIIEDYSTIVIDPGFDARVTPEGLIIAERAERSGTAGGLKVAKGESGAGGADSPDPVLLEVFGNIFMGVATAMGHTLRNTAHSVNIKERLDFSCAVFDPEGGLVAGAQHIPVHLGAMADTVRAVLEDNRPEMRPGDVYASNNPYRGGSHLPDVTVVEPVFSEAGELLFFVAARGHHADIGGAAPGSLPPEASHIDEEGVLIDGLLVVREGVFRADEVARVLTGRRYPARNIPERLSDLKSQVAACARGARELKAVIDRHGWPEVRRYMGHVQSGAEGAVRRALTGFLGGMDSFTGACRDSLDDGTPIEARITITAGDAPPLTTSAVVDFTGTGPQHGRDNLNAPLPVTRSAVLYVLRSITGEDIPLNGGCMAPVEIVVPEGTLLAPLYPAPVASGNVETSQRVVDVLLGALGVAACSQGTMNNLLFEVEGEAPYYETIAGGAGGMDGCPGASGVQVHMTNTRITDPEVLETAHPGVRLRRFTLRRGSGGAGEFPGGDGVVREIEFKRSAEVTIISERRASAPRGAEGGEDGKPGRNLIRDRGGTTRALPHRAHVTAGPGESVIIETPGGGGWGRGR
ncbi:MAG: hydantoinase B/oxoprolinase family protein [Thermodesulfobacteriota bacterium]